MQFSAVPSSSTVPMMAEEVAELHGALSWAEASEAHVEPYMPAFPSQQENAICQSTCTVGKGQMKEAVNVAGAMWWSQGRRPAARWCCLQEGTWLHAVHKGRNWGYGSRHWWTMKAACR